MTEECQIVQKKELDCQLEDQDGAQDVALMHNQTGKLILVRKVERPVEYFELQGAAKAEFQKGEQNRIAIICVDQAEDTPNQAHAYAYTKDFFCWVTPQTEDKTIKIFDTITGYLRYFDPSKYIACTDEESYNVREGQYTVRACDPVQLLKQGLAQSPDEKSMSQLSQYIQVWNTSDHMLLVDLNPLVPIPKAEISGTDQLTDVNNYVSTGFNPAYKNERHLGVAIDETRLGNIILNIEFKE